MTNKVKLLEALTFARDLLTKGWTQGTLARDADGVKTDHQGEDVACFCAMGACCRARDEFEVSGSELMRRVDEQSHDVNIVAFNDIEGRTQAEVVEVFDKAIAKLKAEIIVDNLIAAKALLEVPGAWTTGWFFKDYEGQHASQKTATCFCAMGAVGKVKEEVYHGNDIMSTPEVRLLTQCIPDYAANKLRQEGQSVGVANFNDEEGRTLPEILALFDAAIALAKK